jgi:exosome complex component CSL4
MEDRKKFVVPGDFIGTEEEYLAGSGTHTDGENVYSALAGMVLDEKHTLSVERRRTLASLGIGTVIIGSIENIVEPIALVRVKQGSDEADSRYGDNPDYAVLHASMIKKGYVKNVRDEYKIGDIIRAKIVDIRNGEMRLSSDSPELGAVKAFCAKCRHSMRIAEGGLECESCGAKDNRKVADDYRKVVLG